MLHIFNYSVKKLSNLEWSFSMIDSTWKNKTPIRWIKTFRMVINLSKFFLQNQLFLIVWNQKQMPFFLGKVGSRETKLLNFKRSTKTFTQDTKAIWNYIYIPSHSVIFFHSTLLYQLIGTNMNPWCAVNLLSLTNYWHYASTLLLTLELCSKPLGIFQRVIKNK